MAFPVSPTLLHLIERFEEDVTVREDLGERELQCAIKIEAILILVENSEGI